MARDVIVPALGMAQETAIIVQWLAREGDTVARGEPLAEIETDKARVEIEAPISGILARVAAAVGDEIPVGQAIAVILPLNEAAPRTINQNDAQPLSAEERSTEAARPFKVAASPLASRIAAEHHIDVSRIKPAGKRIQKADVQTYLQQQSAGNTLSGSAARLTPASPKARRLAAEQGRDVASIQGTGPGGAVLAGDVFAAVQQSQALLTTEAATRIPGKTDRLPTSNIWRIMAERTTQSWTSTPHIYLVREVNVSRLLAWHDQVQKRSSIKVTHTDLLVKLVATTLREHPRLNAAWSEGRIMPNDEIHIGLAAAIEEGVVVPVIHQADTLSVGEIAERRQGLVAHAQASKLRPEDLRGGTFTISNLGMYGIDAFTAIINPPQVAILAVGRIAQRVLPVDGQPGVQPTMILSLACDHRAVDGARGAQFLAALAEVIEEPLGLLE